MTVARIASRVAAYTWASPNTALGALFGLLFLCAGGRVRFHAGTAEFSGGRIAGLIGRLPVQCRFCAMTLGHVILGTAEAELAAAREHERVHVQQYERWGPFFLPAYLLSSAWQLLCGRCAYWDNVFERAAYAVDCRPAPRSERWTARAGTSRRRYRLTINLS